MHAKTYKLSALCAIFGLLLTGCLHDKALDANKHNPQSSTVVINAVSPEGVGEKIGTITLTDTAQGLRIQSSLGELPSGTAAGSCRAGCRRSDPADLHRDPRPSGVRD